MLGNSDFDGNFTIEANEGDVLELSYVGFKTQLVKLIQSK